MSKRTLEQGGGVDQIFTLKQIGEKAREKKRRVYVGFKDLEKAFDRVNREPLGQMLRMYEVGGKLLSGFKRMYADSSARVRVKGNESEWFRKYSLVKQECIISPWPLNVYMDGVMKEMKVGMGNMGVNFTEDEGE